MAEDSSCSSHLGFIGLALPGEGEFAFLTGPANWYLKIVLEKMLIIIWQRYGIHPYLSTFTEQQGYQTCSLVLCFHVLMFQWDLYWDVSGFLSTTWLDLSEEGVIVTKIKFEKLKNQFLPAMQNDVIYLFILICRIKLEQGEL